MFDGRPISSLLIDLDGTLVDSLPDLADAVNAMLLRFELAPCTEHDVMGWVGKGADHLVRQALLATGRGAVAHIEFDHAYGAFIEAYREKICVRTRLYPGVRSALNMLSSGSISMACVTNKPYEPTMAVLQGLGISEFFPVVIGGDTLSCKKPDPEMLWHAVRCLDTSIEACIMVGDSINDVDAARAAGIGVVCVSYGYNHGQDIRLSNPDVVLDNLAELPSLLKLDCT